MNKLLKDNKTIIAWLDKYRIENYTLVPDDKYGYVVDVDGDVVISGKDLKHISIQFGKVSGDFYCSHNQLTSLEGSPASVGGNFYCNSNKLTSLEVSPTSIGGHFYCENNEGLGEYQNIIDFAKLKEKITSDREQLLLSNSLKIIKNTTKVIKI